MKQYDDTNSRKLQVGDVRQEGDVYRDILNPREWTKSVCDGKSISQFEFGLLEFRRPFTASEKGEATAHLSDDITVGELTRWIERAFLEAARETPQNKDQMRAMKQLGESVESALSSYRIANPKMQIAFCQICHTYHDTVGCPNEMPTSLEPTQQPEGKTPRTDAAVEPQIHPGYGDLVQPKMQKHVSADFARTLKRELIEANKTIDVQHRLMKDAEKRGADKARQELEAFRQLIGAQNANLTSSTLEIDHLRAELAIIKQRVAEWSDRYAVAAETREQWKRQAFEMQNERDVLRKELDEANASPLLKIDASGVIEIVDLPEISRVAAPVIRQMVAEHNELMKSHAELARVSAERDEVRAEVNELLAANAKLSASSAAMRVELEFVLNEIQYSIGKDDETRLRYFDELIRRFPGFNALQSDAGNSYIPRSSAIKREVVEALLAEAKRLSGIVDQLLNHCGKDECMECSKIVCPGDEPLHLHHDGCPYCALCGKEHPTSAAFTATEAELKRTEGM